MQLSDECFLGARCADCHSHCDNTHHFCHCAGKKWTFSCLIIVMGSFFTCYGKYFSQLVLKSERNETFDWINEKVANVSYFNCSTYYTLTNCSILTQTHTNALMSVRSMNTSNVYPYVVL